MPEKIKTTKNTSEKPKHFVIRLPMSQRLEAEAIERVLGQLGVKHIRIQMIRRPGSRGLVQVACNSFLPREELLQKLHRLSQPQIPRENQSAILEAEKSVQDIQHPPNVPKGQEVKQGSVISMGTHAKRKDQPEARQLPLGLESDTSETTTTPPTD